MSYIVRLYVNKILEEGSTMTIDDVPPGLRELVREALAQLEKAEK